jgi:exo-1,4-beta-D-glucosaminidase
VKTGENILALKVARAKAGELNIGFVDWNPEPADHNMGIWRSVHLLATGPVSIEKPFVKTRVDTATLEHADISLSLMLHNYSDKAINGTLKAAIGKDIPSLQGGRIESGGIKKNIA